ncbi:MAG: SH3 domain-containing protein, partial [Bacteroidota bacterium]
MAYGICNLSIVPIRTEPAHRSEQASQLLFGETFTITDQQNEWVKIKT